MQQPPTVLERLFPPGALRVLFQPIVRRRRGSFELAAVEALVRGPAGSALEAADRLFAYVRSGEDEFAVERGVLKLVLQESSGLPFDCPVAVNLLASVLARSPTFAGELTKGAQAVGLAPERLIVELHEAPSFLHEPWLARSVRDLKAQGVRVALDDRDGEPARLQTAAKLMPDLVKLDWALVRGSHLNFAARTKLVGIIDAARALGAEVVAEGVEGIGELAVVESLGVPLLQGHHLGAPMLATDLLRHPLGHSAPKR